VAANLYALGVTLYRMLLGDEASGLLVKDIDEQVQAGKWPRLDRWPTHVHDPLRRVLRGLMHRDPGKRPASAADLRARLQRTRPIVSWIEIEPQVWTGASTAE
jgi:hypothetical protein